MADMGNDVELTLGVDLLMGNEEEFKTTLAELQNTDIKLDINGSEKNLAEISKQLLNILESEKEISQKSKEMSSALSNDAQAVTTILTQINSQILDGLQKNFQKAQTAINKNNVVEYNSLLTSMKSQAELYQNFAKVYEKNAGGLPNVQIGDQLYSANNLSDFIKYLNDEKAAYTEFVSDFAKTQKKVTNMNEEVKKSYVSKPIVSSLFKNSIASLGKDFKATEKEVNDNIDKKNFDGIEDKVKRLSDLKNTINELMDLSGLTSVAAKDTPFNVSIKKDTTNGINTKFDDIIKKMSSKAPKDIFNNINEYISQTNDTANSLVDNIFKLNNSKINVQPSLKNNNSSFLQDGNKAAKKISSNDKNKLDEAIDSLSMAKSNEFDNYLQTVIKQYNKMAQINYEQANTIFTKLLQKNELIDVTENISDFEKNYQDNLKKAGLSLYKPQLHSSDFSKSTESFSNNNSEMLKMAQEAQKSAEEKAEQYQIQLTKLKSDLQDKETEIKKQQEGIDRMRKTINELRSELNTESKENNEGTKESIQNEIDSLNSQIESKTKEKANLEKELNDLKSQIDKAQSSDQLNNKVDNANEDFKKSNDKINLLQENISALQKDNDNLQKENPKLKESLKGSSVQNSFEETNKSDVSDRIKEINDAMDRFYSNPIAAPLEEDKKTLEDILALYDQLSEEEIKNPNLTPRTEVEDNLAEVNQNLEVQNQEYQERLHLIEQAQIKETELYKEILELQQKFDQVDSEDGSKLGLKNRQQRIKNKKALVTDIENKKKELQEQYPNNDLNNLDELWSDDKISKTKSDIKTSMNGLNDKIADVQQRSVEFIKNTTEIFDNYCKKFDSTDSLESKMKILNEMIQTSNDINNNVIPINLATQNDLKNKSVATSEAINEMIGKFENYVNEKQFEIQSLLNNAKNIEKVVDSTSSKSLSKVSNIAGPKPTAPNIQATEKIPSKALSSTEFIQAMQKSGKIKKSSSDKSVLSQRDVTLSDIVNPLQITDIAVTEEAKSKLNAEVSSSIATIYISDVKLNEDINLSNLQNEISNVLNNNPIKVNIKPNVSTNENADGQAVSSGISIDISAINFTDESIVSTLKNKIETALSPILIRQFNVDDADTSSLNNKISLALNTVKIDRIELNENFDVSSIQKEIENSLSKLQIADINIEGLAQSVKKEIDEALNGLTNSEIKIKAKITKSDQNQFNKLAQAVETVHKAITKKNAAIVAEKKLVNESVPIEIELFEKLANQINDVKTAIGAIKKIKVYFERTSEGDDTPSEPDNTQNSKKPKKSTKQVSGNIENKSNQPDNSINNTSTTENNRVVLTQSQKNKLLEEEYKIKVEIAEIDFKIKQLEASMEKNGIDNGEKEKIESLRKERENKRKNSTVFYQRNDINSITEDERSNFVKNKYLKTQNVVAQEKQTIEKSKKIIGTSAAETAKQNLEQATSSMNDFDEATVMASNDVKKLIQYIGAVQAAVNENNSIRTAGKNSTGTNSINTRYEKIIAQMNKWAVKNPRALKNPNVLSNYNSILRQLQDESNRSSESISELEGSFSKLDGEVQKAGLSGRTFTGEIKNLFEVFGNRAIAGMAVEAVKNGFRQMVENVKEIDSAMTELKKVTDETSTSYDKFLQNAGTKAEALGSTMTDLINSTADFAKLGYNLQDASSLAENAIMYSNVGDLDIQTATSDIVSAMKAFDIEADDAIKIVDSFNEVGNNYAVSAQQIGEALQNSASSLVVAGNNIDESIAMITAMTEITQDAASAGAALRTLSLRIRGAKTE